MHTMPSKYPNSSDKILGKHGNLGDNIFIIGNCVTWGCIPITRDEIKELYLIVVETYSYKKKYSCSHFSKKIEFRGFF